MDDLLSLTTRVLRDPDSVAVEHDARTVARLAPPLLALACGGAALLGVAAGTSSGALQSFYAAVKLPALFLAPPLVVLPLVHGLAAACGVPTPWSRLGLATLAGLARSGLLAAAAAPLLWLPLSLDADYHLAVLLFTGTFALVVLPALTTIARAVPAGGRLRIPAIFGALAMLGLVTAQTGWVLRPFVARPRGEVAFLRPVEASVFSAVAATARSALGDYSDDWAPTASGVWRSE